MFVECSFVREKWIDRTTTPNTCKVPCLHAGPGGMGPYDFEASRRLRALAKMNVSPSPEWLTYHFQIIESYRKLNKDYSYLRYIFN